MPVVSKIIVMNAVFYLVANVVTYFRILNFNLAKFDFFKCLWYIFKDDINQIE